MYVPSGNGVFFFRFSFDIPGPGDFKSVVIFFTRSYISKFAFLKSYHGHVHQSEEFSEENFKKPHPNVHSNGREEFLLSLFETKNHGNGGVFVVASIFLIFCYKKQPSQNKHVASFCTIKTLFREIAMILIFKVMFHLSKSGIHVTYKIQKSTSNYRKKKVKIRFAWVDLQINKVTLDF